MRSPLTRVAIEEALDDLIANQRGIDFQRIAVPLARQRCPGLVANEVTKDGGEDAFLAFVESDESSRLAVGCSITATWTKIRKDIKRAKTRRPNLNQFWFYTPRKVNVLASDPWVANAKKEFNVDLIVVPREDIAQSLLSPSLRYLARHHLGLRSAEDVVTEAMLAQLADDTPRRIQRWLQHSLTLEIAPINRTYVRCEGNSETSLAVNELAVRIGQGGLTVVHGEGGLGKTVALAQIAGALQVLPVPPIPILMSAPVWARSGRSIPEYVAQQVGADQQSIVVKLIHEGSVALFFNGWNEIEVANAPTAALHLQQLLLNAPNAAVIVTTRQTAAPELHRGFTVALQPLSRAARKELLARIAPAELESLLQIIERNAELQDLTRLPLFLVALVQAVRRGEPAPHSRYGLLTAAYRSFEHVPDHAPVLASPLARMITPSLQRLARELTARATTTCARIDAASWIRDIVNDRANELLDIILRHHALAPDANDSIRFQHEYFQDLLCADHLRQWLLANPSEEELRHVLDDRRYDASLHLLVESLVLDRDTTELRSLISRLFHTALDIEVLLAARWYRLLSRHLDRDAKQALLRSIQVWLEIKGGRPLALLAITAAQVDEFANVLSDLIGSPNEQIRNQAYLIIDPFPVELLSIDWRMRVASWSPDARADFALQAVSVESTDRLVVLKHFALRDPDDHVRGRCIAHLAYEEPCSAAALLSAAATPTVIDHILQYGTLSNLPTALVAPFLPHIEKLAQAEPPTALASAALQYLAEAAPQRALRIYKRKLDQARDDVNAKNASQAIELVFDADPLFAQDWVLRRLQNQLSISEYDDQILAIVSQDELRNAAHSLLNQQTIHPYRFKQALLTLLRFADAETVTYCVDQIIQYDVAAQDPAQRLPDVMRERRHAIAEAVASAPLNTVMQVLDAATRSSDLVVVRAAVGLLTRALKERSGVEDERQRDSIVAFIERFLPTVLGADDENGTVKDELAELIATVADERLRPQLRQLIVAERTRVQHFFTRLNSERKRGGTAYMPHERRYIEFVSQLPGAAQLEHLFELFEDEMFELEAGHMLVRFLAPPLAGTVDGFFHATDWFDVAQAQRVPRLPPTDAHSRRFIQAIDHHIQSWRGRELKPFPIGSIGGRIEGLLRMYARMTCRQHSAMPPPVAWTSTELWNTENRLHVMLRAGITVSATDALASLAAISDPAHRYTFAGDQREYITRKLFIALMFSDDLRRASEVLREHFSRTNRDRWQLHELLEPLSVSLLPDRAALILEAMPRDGGDSYWHEWSNAVRRLSREEQYDLAFKLFTDDRWISQISQLLRAEGLTRALTQIVEREPQLRERVNQFASITEPRALTHLAQSVLLDIADAEAALLAVQLAIEDEASRPFATRMLRQARFFRRIDHPRIPDDHSPRPLGDTRRLLLRTLHGNHTTAAWAHQELVNLDANLYWSMPIEEPRHPDQVSRLMWPTATPSSGDNDCKIE